MTPCSDCMHEKANTVKAVINCSFCDDYSNYKSRNKRTFLLIVIIPYTILLVGFIGLWISK